MSIGGSHATCGFGYTSVQCCACICLWASNGARSGPVSFTLNKNPHTLRASLPLTAAVSWETAPRSLLGIDSLSNWSSYFYYPGVDGNGLSAVHLAVHHGRPLPVRHGNDDENGGTTSIGARSSPSISTCATSTVHRASWAASGSSPTPPST